MANFAFLLSLFFFALMQAVARAMQHLAIDGATSTPDEMVFPSKAGTSCKTVDAVAKVIWRGFHESENRVELMLNIDNSAGKKQGGDGDEKARFLVFCESQMSGLVDMISASKRDLMGCFEELLEKPVDQLCLDAWESSVSDHICYIYAAAKNNARGTGSGILSCCPNQFGGSLKGEQIVRG